MFSAEHMQLPRIRSETTILAGQDMIAEGIEKLFEPAGIKHKNPP